MSLYQNLIAYYKMNEPSGTREDSHGNYTMVESGAFPIASSGGHFVDGVDFSTATSGNMVVPNQDFIDPTKNFTIGFWSKVNDSGYLIISWKSLPSRGINLELSSGFLILNGYGASPSVTWWQHPVGTWDDSYIMLTYNASTQKAELWFDGVKVIEDFSFTFDAPTGLPLQIGGYNIGPSTILDGVIDELAIWNRTLTDAEALQMYNDGAGLQYEKISQNQPIFKITNRGIV